MSCGTGHRQGSDLTLLWLWCRPAAIAPIRPLAWKPQCAVGTAIKRPKQGEKRKTQEQFVRANPRRRAGDKQGCCSLPAQSFPFHTCLTSVLFSEHTPKHSFAQSNRSWRGYLSTINTQHLPFRKKLFVRSSPTPFLNFSLPPFWMLCF